MKKLRIPLILSLALLGLPAALSAERFSYSGDSLSSVIAQGKERTVIEGHARITLEKTVITADRIELYGNDNRYATCTGNVTLMDSKRGIRATTARLDYDKTLKLSRLQGPTVMEDKENKVVIKGSFIENDEETEIITIQVGVRILKDDMVCRSEYAIYRRSEDKLELTGLPVVVKGQNESRAARIVINIKTNEIRLEGEVTGNITQEDASPSPAPAASPAPAPDASPDSSPDASPDSSPEAASPTAASPDSEASADLEPSSSPSPSPAPDGPSPGNTP